MSRHALQLAKLAAGEAGRQCEAAAEVVERARILAAKAERAAASRDTVAAAIAKHRTEEMRSGVQAGPLPAHLVEAKRVTDAAGETMGATRTALAQLEDELAEAEAAEKTAQAAVTQAAIRVLQDDAETMARRLIRMTQERDALRDQLADLANLWVPLAEPRLNAFGSLIEIGAIAVGPIVTQALNPPLAAATLPQPAAWQNYLKALEADADAPSPAADRNTIHGS